MPKIFSELPTPPRIEAASWGVHSLPFSGCTCLQAVALDKSQGFGEGLKEVKESQVNGSAGIWPRWSPLRAHASTWMLPLLPRPKAQEGEVTAEVQLAGSEAEIPN